jgi:hypothetical protein
MVHYLSMRCYRPIYISSIYWIHTQPAFSVHVHVLPSRIFYVCEPFVTTRICLTNVIRLITMQ